MNLSKYEWRVEIARRGNFYNWIAYPTDGCPIWSLDGRESFTSDESALEDWINFAEANGLDDWFLESQAA